MTSMTIVEALAEVKTLSKRIKKKEEFVIQYLLRQEKLKDPLERDNGSVNAITRERQAISDLQKRIVNIRCAIAQVNMGTRLKIGHHDMTLTEWLTWRRDVAPMQQKFLTQLRQRIDSHRTMGIRQGSALVQAGEPAKPEDIVVNLSEAKLAEEIEQLETTLGTLDGQLSLKNATLVIDV